MHFWNCAVLDGTSSLDVPLLLGLQTRLWVWDPDFGYSIFKIMAFISTRGREKRNCLPWKTAIQKQFPLKFSLRVMKIQSKGGGGKKKLDELMLF